MSLNITKLKISLKTRPAKIIVVASIVVIIALIRLYQVQKEKFTIDHRPMDNRYVYDYAGILDDLKEYPDKYLYNLKEKYALETIIVSLPNLGDEDSVDNLAAKIITNWEIGKDYGWKGILLLFIKKSKQIKLEVSYELEDIFTDAFCGYIEDKQLKPYYLNGQLAAGFLAVMEEIERRAGIKNERKYTASYIKRLDDDLISGGAGAVRDLSKYSKEYSGEAGKKYPAGKSPDEAWQIMINSWRDRVRDANLGIYTETTKLIYRDYQHQTDSRFDDNVRTYAKKEYKVIKNDNYAVIFFGNKEGWENSPFLFCRTPEGWKFDVVHQRKYIRMGPNPHWGIERGNHPYVNLLSQCPYYTGQDIPLENEDIFRVDDDVKLAEKIRSLEMQYNNNPNDFSILMDLGRLYTITSMGPKTIQVLNKALELNPSSPLPYKYRAINYVDTTYQYKAAIEDIKVFIKKVPENVFGHNYLGYLYLSSGKYEDAVSEFEKALKVNDNNCYAYTKLSECYTKLFRESMSSTAAKNRYKTLALEMFEKAKNVPSVDTRRINWLKQWLEKEGIF